MKTKLLILLALALLLAGCGPMTQADPVSAQLTGEADNLLLYQAQLRATGTASVVQAQARETQMALDAQATAIERERVQWTVEAQQASARQTQTAAELAASIRQTQVANEVMIAQAQAQATLQVGADRATSTARAGEAQATATAQAGNAQATGTEQAAGMWLEKTAQSADSAIRAQATLDAAAASLADQGVRRGEMQNQGLAFLQLAGAPVLIMLAVALFIFVIVFATNHRTIRRDERGVLPGVFHNGKWIDGDLATGAVTDPSGPQILLPTMLQAALLERKQRLLALRIATDPTVRGGPADMLESLMAPTAQVQAPAYIPDRTPEMADFSAVMDARNRGVMLLGVGENGLVRARRDTPHLIMAGQTGSGKSTAMRAVILQYILAGARVTILDKSGKDFGVFDGYANVLTFDARKPDIAVPSLVAHMKAAWNEIIRRQVDMRSSKSRNWTGQADVLVVDELDNWGGITNDSETTTTRLWQYPKMIAREGRSAGVWVVTASQNPVAENVSLDLRRNSTPVAFRLGDRYASNTVIGTSDAVGLETGHFLALVGSGETGLVHGVGFNPEDDEILQALERGGAKKLIGKPEWMAGIDEVEDAEFETITGPVYSEKTIKIALQIEPLYRAQIEESGKPNKSALARELGKTYAGSTVGDIAQAINYLENSTTTS